MNCKEREKGINPWHPTFLRGLCFLLFHALAAFDFSKRCSLAGLGFGWSAAFRRCEAGCQASAVQPCRLRPRTRRGMPSRLLRSAQSHELQSPIYPFTIERKLLFKPNNGCAQPINPNWPRAPAMQLHNRPNPNCRKPNIKQRHAAQTPACPAEAPASSVHSFVHAPANRIARRCPALSFTRAALRAP